LVRLSAAFFGMASALAFMQMSMALLVEASVGQRVNVK
jgi:hypothetical protein